MKHTLLHVALATTLVTATGTARADPDAFSQWNVMGEAAPEAVAVVTAPAAATAPASTTTTAAVVHVGAPSPIMATAHLHADASLAPGR